MLKDKTILIALNKPKGFICTHKDEFNRKKAIDLIPKKILYEDFISKQKKVKQKL